MKRLYWLSAAALFACGGGDGGGHEEPASSSAPVEPGRLIMELWVLPPLSVGEMTLRLYGALSYSQNSARDLRCALNGA